MKRYYGWLQSTGLNEQIVIPIFYSQSSSGQTHESTVFDVLLEGTDQEVFDEDGNLWRSLTTKIQKDEKHKNFRCLSFGKLRKTAGNLIRMEADGEVAGVFLCHGTPVKSDDLLDVYTNRPFPKVFNAIDIVEQRLSQLWTSVEDPFPDRRKKGGGNIPLSKIHRIQKLRKQGYKVAYIAEKTGVSHQTVIRHSSKKKKDG